MEIIITAPSLDENVNVSGVSAVTKFIINNDQTNIYHHFKLGKADNEKRGINSYWRIIKDWYAWSSVLKKKKKHLIHFNYALDKRSIIRDSPLIFYARFLKKKFIIHLHGGEYLHNEKTPGWLNKLLKITLRGKETIIVLSPVEKEIIQNKFQVKNVIVLPNTVDTNEAQKFERNYSYHTSSQVNILFIGRIVERKGIWIILEALTNLKRKGIDFKYILAGTGPEEKEYIEECKNSLNNQFEFKGIVSGTQKINLYKDCDIFLLPSLSGEGLPMALLESMSFGLCPIVTSDGSMKFVITNNENGVLVDKNSPVSLENALFQKITDRESLKIISLNAKKFIFANYNTRKYIDQLNEIYKKTDSLQV